MWQRTISWAAMAAGLLACHHDDGRASTTTIRSGETVTTSGAAPVTPYDRVSPADRLTDAICRHDHDCSARRAGMSPEALLRRGATCSSEVKQAAELGMEAVDCSPAVFEAGLKDCLAAVEAQDCNSSDRVIFECRPSQLCRTTGLSNR